MLDYVEELFKKLVGFFVDRDHSVTKRLSIGVIILGLAFIIDDQVGFSFYYSTTQKIVQAERLANVLSSDSIDLTTKRELRALQLRILRRRGTISYLWDLTKSAINSRNIQTNSTAPNSIIESQRNVFLHVISSNWALIIISTIGVISLLLQKKVGGYEAGAIIIIIVMIVLLVIVFSYIFSLIPIIYGNPIYNYVLNAILHSIIIVIVARLVGKYTN